MSATRLVACLPVPSGSCPSTGRGPSAMAPDPPLPPPPSPPCRRYDTSSSYFDKGREAGNGDGTGRDMGSLKNGYGPGLEGGGCHPLNTTGRNKTSLSTFPPTKAPLQQPLHPVVAVRSWLIPRRHLHHLFFLLLLLVPCVTHAATGYLESPLLCIRLGRSPTLKLVARSLALSPGPASRGKGDTFLCLFAIVYLFVCVVRVPVRECV